MLELHNTVGQKVGFSIAFVNLLALCLVSLASASNGEEIALNQYKPIAMDESWSISRDQLVDNPHSILGDDSLLTIHPNTTASNFDNDSTKPPSLPFSDSNTGDPSSLDDVIVDDSPLKNRGDTSILTNVEDSDGKNIPETLFEIPQKGTKSLTKLITGVDSPTFVRKQLTRPTIQKNPNSKVLASYKIMVPIFIPALKTTNKIRELPGKEVQFVKETHTEMVPMKKKVASNIKTVIKAERVPQRIITDYVRADGNSVPSSVDDKLKPNEQVLKSVVTNYD